MRRHVGLEYAALSQDGAKLPDGWQISLFELDNEPMMVAVYKYGIPMFKARSKSKAYLYRRLKKYIEENVF